MTPYFNDHKNWIIPLLLIAVGASIVYFVVEKTKFNHEVPSYIHKDNWHFGYQESEEKIHLGRVLFYDKKLSLNNSTACASCHQQQFAFGDTAMLSLGQSGGRTGRHSMRLINTRFSIEDNFFWDERAHSLEDQTTKPIKDHIEMGFSGKNGNPDLDSLIRKLEPINYYQTLFAEAYGDAQITEKRMQKALAQFVTSIQSFDSRYDEGLAKAKNPRADFDNFTVSENRGKRLYMSRPQQGGAGCNRCHRAPEFAIGPEVRSNGVIGVASNPLAEDLTNTRAPTLRDLVNPKGFLNGKLMHDGSKKSIREVIDHYNDVPYTRGVDRRLRRGGSLNLTEQEKVDLENFLLTLTGNDVYTNSKWSEPALLRKEEGSKIN